MANANGAVTLTMTTSDLGNTGTGGTLTDSDSRTINVTSPSNVALTTATNDAVFFSTGTNFVTGTTTTLNGTDSLTGGSGTDTLTVTDGSLGPFTFGTGNIAMTGFEVLKLVDTNGGNHSDNLTFLASFNNGGTLIVDGSGIGGNGKLIMDASATSNAFNVIGGNSDDTISLGAGVDVINGGNGDDRVTGGGGADTLTGDRKSVV